MKHGEETTQKKKSTRSRRRKRALRLRRRLALISGLLAAIMLALAVHAAPGLGVYAWGAAALCLTVEALLLCRRRGLPGALYILLGALCLALMALGVAVRDYVTTDRGIVPAESLVTTLTVTDDWPANISRYTGLAALDMRGSSVTDFTPILNMRGLRALDVRGNTHFDREAYDAVSAALPECDIDWSFPIAGRYVDSDTDHLDLTGSGLGTEEIAALRREYPDIDFTYTVPLMGKEIDPDAEVLDLRGATEVDPDAITAALSLLPNVTRVDLKDAPVTLDVVEALTSWNPTLIFDFTFAIPGGTMDSDAGTVTLPGGNYEDLQAAMAFIPYMPNLQYMDARAIVMNAAEQESLRSDPNSAKVLYNFTVYGQNVNTLTTSLNLDNTPIQSAAEIRQVLSALPNLQTVSMVGCGLNQQDMIALCEAHPQIHFIWVVQFGKYQLRTDATAFTTNLYANNKEHYTSETFQVLKYCTDLQMLDIGHCDVTDISFIAGMKHLKVLILADNEITDISVLADKDELEYVELFLNKITDLTPLANKPALMDLNIYYNRPQDLSPLATDTALRRLWLGECNLSSGQISAIKKALPNCKVNYKGSSSTGNGWREHRHYTTLKQMYKQGVYIPFS